MRACVFFCIVKSAPKMRIALNPTTSTAGLSAYIHRPAQTSIPAPTPAPSGQTRILRLLRRSAICRLCGKLGWCSNRRILLWGWHGLTALRPAH